MCAEERVVELALAWWARARDDLSVAERIADTPFACCFHCQQAVEKAVKTLLIVHQIDFAKRHDIGQLLELLGASPTAPDESVTQGLEALTRFAVETRYPPGQAGPEEVQEALLMAKRFLDWAQEHLPQRV